MSRPLKIGDEVRKTDPFDGSNIIFTIHDIDKLNECNRYHREGKADYAVLVNGKYEPVPKEVTNRCNIDECLPCHA